MSNSLTKYIAAYRSGCLGDNILASYFPLFANIICEEGWHIINASDVASKFESKYQIKLPLPFVRQVLSIGVSNGSIIEDHGVYATQNGVIRTYLFDDKSFDDQWSRLKKQFKRYCDDICLDLTKVDIEKRILTCINDSDEKIVQNEEVVINDTSDTFDYAWYQFLRACSEKDKDLFDFVASLSLSNILQQALFYSGNGQESYKDLNVYLDSPIVFALIGMDLPARCESCRMLVKEMQK